jgi:SAM-dependent methyltransferase
MKSPWRKSRNSFAVFHEPIHGRSVQFEILLGRIRNVFLRRRDYQLTRKAGTTARWKLIESRSESASSLLDVGCNTGRMTALAAERGFFAIGLDANWSLLAQASRRCRRDLSLGYVHFVVTPQSVSMLPLCDLILCLSVHHQWHKKFGHEGAQTILRILGAKARQKLFFEPASRQSKYGAQPPPIVDFDERSIIDYNMGMLGGLFGSEHVGFLGGAPAAGSEPFRYLFVVETASSQGQA